MEYPRNIHGIFLWISMDTPLLQYNVGLSLRYVLLGIPPSPNAGLQQKQWPRAL